MAKFTPSIIASLLLLCLVGTVQAQTTTIRGASKGTSTPQPVTSTASDANHTGLDVNIVGGAGSGGDGAILDGVSSAIKATVFDFTNSNPLGVVLRDTNGDYVSVGGGTQYNQGTATTDTDTLSMAGCVRSDTAAIATGVIDQDRARCIVDATGRMWVHVGTIDGGTITSITNPVAVTGTFFQATQPISGTVTVTDGAGALNVIVDSSALPSGASTLTEQQTQTTALQLIDNIVSGTGANVSQLGGVNVSMNTGVRDTGTQRVTIATNDVVPASQSGTWTVQPGNTPNTSPWLSEPIKVASANNVGTCASGSVSTTALASNASRRVAYIAASPANTDDVYVKLGATATSSNFRLAPGQPLNLGGGGSTYTGVVDFIPASGTQVVCAMELN